MSCSPFASKMSSFIFLASFAVIGALLATTIVLGVLYGKERQKTIDNQATKDQLCLNPQCIKAANYFLDSIDETVNPCENFFDFACGKWVKNTKIPSDANSETTFRKLALQLNDIIDDLLSSAKSNRTTELKSTTNARRMYASCVNETGIEIDDIDGIMTFINTQFGGWPILQGSTWSNPTFDFSRLLLKLDEHGSNAIFSIFTQVDERNSSIQNIRIGQGSLGLGDRSYYLNDSSNLMKAYRQYMRDLASSLTNDTSTIDQDIDAMLTFEKSISTYFWSPGEQSAHSEENIRTTVGGLASSINISFDFTSYIRSVYLLANVTLLNTDVVTVSELPYLGNVSLLIQQQSSRTLQNYVVWRFLMVQASNMPKRFRNIKQQFNKVYQGVSIEPSRTVVCGEYVNNIMGFAVAKLYIDEYFDETAKNESRALIKNVRNAFIDMATQSTWMDAISKTRAIEKANAMAEKIGYPDFLNEPNMTKLETMYANHVFNESYIKNVLLMLKLSERENLRRLREPVDRSIWYFSPIIVNAFYDPSFNDISFPAGILQPPFFHKDLPKYLNYGGIGMVMGHEITHGFDDEGRKFDKDGNKLSWWTNATIDAFNRRKQCIIDQYSNYTLAQVNLQLNGQQTQGENIADNGGLKEAFYAYRKWAQENENVDKKLPGLEKYSVEQMLFLNLGQLWCIKGTNEYFINRIKTGVHSPNQFRVIGPTSNFDEFDRAFNCKLGQGNSRVEKCSVW